LSTPRLGRLTPGEETQYTLYRRLGGPQGRSGRVWKISSPTGCRSADRPARSESQYQLLYSYDKEIENDYVRVAEVRSECKILVRNHVGDLAIDIGMILKQVSVKWGVKVRCERNWFGIVPSNTLSYRACQQVLYQLRDREFHCHSRSNHTSHWRVCKKVLFPLYTLILCVL
jgi:hypothetical protein